MEPVEGVEAVPKNRWKLVSQAYAMMPKSIKLKICCFQMCSLCRERVGACIQCDNRNCFTAFHVTCARQMGLLMSMKSVGTDGSLRAFCDKHIPVALTFRVVLMLIPPRLARGVTETVKPPQTFPLNLCLADVISKARTISPLRSPPNLPGLTPSPTVQGHLSSRT